MNFTDFLANFELYAYGSNCIRFIYEHGDSATSHWFDTLHLAVQTRQLSPDDLRKLKDAIELNEKQVHSAMLAHEKLLMSVFCELDEESQVDLILRNTVMEMRPWVPA